MKEEVRKEWRVEGWERVAGVEVKVGGSEEGVEGGGVGGGEVGGRGELGALHGLTSPLRVPISMTLRLMRRLAMAVCTCASIVRVATTQPQSAAPPAICESGQLVKQCVRLYKLQAV